MRAMKNRLRILLAVGMVFVGGTSSHAQQATPQRPVNWLQAAFGYSFYMFDGCGDGALGALHRKAILEKLDHCPFAEADKERFHAWAIGETIRENDFLKRYVDEHGKYPDRLPGMAGTCREHQLSETYLTTRELLKSYGRGETSVDIVLPETCAGPVGGP